MSSKKNSHKTGQGSPLPEYNIALLGELGVGKSALTVKYITRRFIMEYDPDIEDTYTKHDVIDNQESLVHVMDTSDKVDSDADRYLRWADAFLIIYSITNSRSFAKAKEYLENVTSYLKCNHKDTPVALVGNKVDLERYRKVGKDEGNSVAAEYDCSFYETTAAEDYEYVEEVFHGVIQELQREKDRTLPLQPLYISEDKTNSLLLTPGSTGHFALLRSRSPKPPLSPAEKKEDKVTQRKTTPSFRLFNKSFKIFN